MTDTTHDMPTDPGDELIFANDRMRVWAMNLEPGQSIFYHSHQQDHLILWPTAGRARVMEIDDEQEWQHVQDSEAGFALFKTVGRDGLKPHRLRNEEDHAVTHYIVELVGTSASETEQTAVTNGRAVMSRPHAVIDPYDYVDPAEHRIAERWS